jgi:hypothetical protein
MMMPYNIKRCGLIASLVICWCSGWYGSYSWGGSMSPIEQTLDNVSAMGDITVGGNFDSSCTNSASNVVCVGTYVWTDDHTGDASVNKGAIVMDGYTQQNLVSNINVNTAQSPTATGANVVGTINIPIPGITLSLTNSNNATGLIGGF